MAEIEVKAKIDAFEPVLQKLHELGCALSDPVVQNDVIFTNGDPNPKTRNIIRIRTTKGRHILTLKRDREDELDCIEVETEVSDPAAMRAILEMMGYSERVRVNKERRKSNYKEYEICLDRVEGLGDFIEVEKFSEEAGDKIKQELMDFMNSLGVNPANRVFHGYDTLVQQKNHDRS